MRAYHRVDPLMDERKGHYTPAQLGAFVKVQLLAGRQRTPGRFRSAEAIRNIVPAAYVEHLAFLFDEGDLVTLDDGTVYLDGWDEWQEGDLTVSERMARLRNRRRNSGVTGAVTSVNQTVTESVTSTVTGASPTANANARVNADVVLSEGGPGGTDRSGLAHISVEVGTAWSGACGKTLLGSGAFAAEYVDDAASRHGPERVVSAIRRARTTFDRVPAPQPLAVAVRSILDPLPDSKAMRAAEAEAEQAERSRRGTEATLRNLHANGAHADAAHPRCPACRRAGVPA